MAHIPSFGGDRNTSPNPVVQHRDSGLVFLGVGSMIGRLVQCFERPTQEPVTSLGLPREVTGSIPPREGMVGLVPPPDVGHRDGGDRNTWLAGGCW
jgi:hypothetical protein